MKKILHVTSSPRGEASNSNKLGNKIVEKIQSRYPGSTVTVNDVVDTKYAHIEAELLGAFMGTGDASVARHSDAAVEQVETADIIVISVPLYNFSIPSALKAWIDHIVRAGRTFSYATGKPEGLLKGKKVYLAIASKGVYSDGPMKNFDFSEPYLRFILGFIGLTDVTTYRIEGDGMVENAVENGLASVEIL
ncbi:FMN-dependent NADH-azoreductase [Chitinophaga sp. YR573]|uniref:FMN-dependent NADH-azoreductase n=1 Tax=Chitinophaga sp. YR573 TaxID=1881040 RepID=UPI0008B220E1|nr:NAD(P)H-dependent oxidoreductase [Chitinophaga sp. YR573]SEW36821.1 FMN-dependent NADH-azoreductase [Chitinophaga sp. YR573]